VLIYFQNVPKLYSFAFQAVGALISAFLLFVSLMQVIQGSWLASECV